MAARSRLLLLRSLFTAVRTATRPGGPGLGERLSAVPRMVRSARSGHYRGITLTRIGLMAAAVAYIVSPVDLMPEGLLSVFGLADDAMVLSWLAAAVINETESYLTWERSGSVRPYAAASPQGWPQDAQGRPQDAPAPRTVSGTVLR